MAAFEARPPAGSRPPLARASVAFALLQRSRSCSRLPLSAPSLQTQYLEEQKHKGLAAQDANARKGTSKFRGVSITKAAAAGLAAGTIAKPWRMSVRLPGLSNPFKEYHATEEGAARAYDGYFIARDGRCEPPSRCCLARCRLLPARLLSLPSPQHPSCPSPCPFPCSKAQGKTNFPW